MADNQPALEALRRTEATPIAQLHPDIDNAKARVVDGVITITWPYSVVTKSTAFILAEHDFRLRRQKGQVRIEFHGAAGRALADSGIGGGDEIRISLEGAKWESHQARTRLPGSTQDWQLKFTNRLLLNVRRAETEGPDAIDIDAPEEEEPQPSLEDGPVRGHTPPLPASQPLEDQSTPIARTAASLLPAKRQASSTLEPEEYASPAFLKRARVSYGSLFEGGLDIFDEDKGKQGKNERRPRFSMNNTAWRYSSRSPSPEANQPSDRESDPSDESAMNAEAQVATGTPKVSPPQGAMKDEGCQTQDLYFSSSMDVQVSAESSRLAAPAASPTPTPVPPRTHYESNHVSFQTPSRTLFGHEVGPHEAPRSAKEPVMQYETAAPQDHGFGPGAPEPHDDANMFSVPPVAGSVMSTAAFSEGIAASDYPIATFGDHSFPTTTSNIDPSLQFPSEMSAQDHVYYHAPPPEDMTWHDKAVSAEYPSAPLQNSNHHPMAMVADSSPPREQSPDAESEAASIYGSARSSHRSGSREDETLRDNPPRETEQEPANGDGEEKEYQDGGDIPGEDYDLRNYDHTKADDESESDDDLLPDSSDVEQQAIDLTEESDESEEDEIEEEQQVQERVQVRVRDGGAGYDEESAESVDDGVDAEEHAVYAGANHGAPFDAEVEDYDVEEDYYEGEDYDEEYDQDDEEDYDDDGAQASGPPPKVPAPEEPVFISLLSDSEDENEPPATQTTSSIPSAQPKGLSQLGEPEVESLADSAEHAEAQAGDEPSVKAEMDAGDAHKAAEQEAGDEENEKPGSEDRPLASQPVQLAPSEAADVGDGGAKDDDASQLVGPEAEELQPTENEAKAQVTTGIVDSGPSDLMDVDETLDAEEQAHRLIDRGVQRQTHRTDAFMMDGGADERDDTAPDHCAVGVEAMDTEPAETQDTEEDEDMSVTAPDVVTQDGSDNQPAESHLEVSMSDAVMSSRVTEVGDEHVRASLPDGQREASEAIADMETVEAVITEEKVEHMQVPTPNETQPQGDASVPLQNKAQPSQENEDDFAAEAQIISEYEEYRPPTKQGARAAGDVGTDPGAAEAASTEARDEGQTEDDDQEPEILITAVSLRSRRQGKTRRSDTTGESHEDPSILLAKAPAPETGHEKQPKSPTTLRVTRNKSDQPDPSILLAQASAGDVPHLEDDGSSTTLRVTRSMADQADAGAHLAKTSPSSNRSTRRHATPPETTRELRSKPSEQARPRTPDAVAEPVLKSPSVAGSVPEDEGFAALKRQLQRTLRTSLPDFLSLRSLHSSLTKTVDVLAVCTLTPPQPHRPKHGPRDYMLELILTDPSTAPSSVSVAHVFRPHQASLPVVHAGDIVLLRRMQVVSIKGRGFGVRVGDASAWAVFEKGDEEMLPQIKGPPVEVAEEEVEYAQGLRRWWAMQDEKALAKVDKATQKASQAGKDDSK
ncbi:Uncharacterized protein TPAR_02767 [Tolypocladium paradoxum]|uniref:Telomeric single stranded DNA binding POT1/Cdc13 domain-containing protein n=1 Tax=Tolypocladium paradoxum TaxID=94208 RepID=A0A2S4L3Q0_9HYPO|nr:Uncharacterized protein TPAR_02767 [Tolypocladium paradoxum]